MQNHFDLFQLTPQFEIDMAQLDRAYREVQSQVHPDKFVQTSAAEQRIAMQWATRANEAYQVLKNPLKRATYLCQLNGIDLETESNTSMPTAFLMQQMEWREELDESKNNPDALGKLERQVDNAHRQQIQIVAEQLAKKNYQEAAQSLRQLMFLEKFSDDIANAQED